MFNKNKKRFILILFVILIIILVVFVIRFFIYKDELYIHNSNEIKSNYENKESYFNDKRRVNFRNVEYIGGEELFINRPNTISEKEYTYVGNRWYPFYIDKDTNEILRGLENYNFITVGIPYVGIDKMKVPKERKTIKGFQNYVLNWTGGVSCAHKNYISDSTMRENLYGRYYGNGIYDVFRYGYFDRPIDLVADYLWGNANETTDGYDIYDLDDVKNYNYSVQIIELSPNEWVMNILRNCFGFISDDFYDLYNKNIINFDEIDIENVSIGDIGVYGNEKIGYHMGICVGYDKVNNPIFSICTTNKYLKDIDDYIENDLKIKGFNILHIEKVKEMNNNLFNNYYKTNLPFENSVVHKKDIMISDISEYNSQVKNENKKKMHNKLIDERIRRIDEREKKAEEIRKERKIDLEQYKSIDISAMYMINETYTYEYQHLFKNVSEDKKSEYHRKTYDEWKQQEKERLNDYKNNVDDETFELMYESSKDLLLEFVTNNKDILKNKTEKEVEKWYYEEYGGVARVDLDILLKFLQEYPECLE